MQRYLLFSMIMLLSLSCCIKKITAVSLGQKAPNFRLMDSTGQSHNLSDFSGNKIALYFFPKAWTPYCTRQACALRDNFTLLKKHGIAIVGISNDSQQQLAKFSKKYNLPFPLLSDPGQQVIKIYGAKRLLPFNKRKTFLIDEQGTIIVIIDNVDVNNHAQQIVNEFVSYK